MDYESAPRYALIVETDNNSKYYYDKNNGCLTLLRENDKEIKCSLPAIDYLTSNFSSVQDFCDTYGLNEKVKKIYIKYVYKGDKYLAPVFNNQIWAHIAYSYNGKEINYKDQINLKAFNDVYFELTNINSSFANIIINNPNKSVRICKKTKDEIVSLVAHERAINSKIDDTGFVKDYIYFSDKSGFYIDLRTRLSNYKDFRSIYLNYCKYINKNEEKVKKDIQEKKKVLIPPMQLSMFE